MSFFKHKPRIPIFCLCVALTAAGCKEQKQALVSTKEIARVGDISISEDSFQTLLNMRSRGASNRFATLAAKEALLDELVRREAVLAKAKAAGFDQRPDIQESVRRLIAAKFQEEQMKQLTSADPTVTEPEITAYYMQHPEKYATPAKAHGAIIFLKISPLADEQSREQKMAKAQSLLEQAKVAARNDFARLVEANSEDQSTRYRAGDIGWVNRETRSWELDPAIIETLFSLQKPGDFAPLVPTKKGVYIVKLLDSQPSGVRPLKEVKEAIGYALRKQIIDQREQDFFASMKSGLNISINRPLLESIQPPPPPEKTPPSTPGGLAQTK